MSDYTIEDYTKDREKLKKDYPDAYWWFEDQLILPQNSEEIEHLDYFENELFYIFNTAIREVEKKVKQHFEAEKVKIHKYYEEHIHLLTETQPVKGDETNHGKLT